jgi:hypothetical protein
VDFGIREHFFADVGVEPCDELFEVAFVRRLTLLAGMKVQLHDPSEMGVLTFDALFRLP